MAYTQFFITLVFIAKTIEIRETVTPVPQQRISIQVSQPNAIVVKCV